MRFKLVAIALSLMGLTGCVIREDHAVPVPTEVAGDINFVWTFEGRTCLQTPEVQSVRIFIPGEPLDNNGNFPCNAGGVDGIRLKNFAPGNYNFTIDGVDGGGKTIYTTSGTLHVNGSITQQVTLNRVGGAREKMQVFWTFGGRAKMACAQGGVTKVLIKVNNGDWVTRPCSDVDPVTRSPVEGVAIGNIDAGTYQVEFDAYVTDPRSHDDLLTFSANVSLPVVAGGANNFNVTMDWVSGLANFVPAFQGATSCAQAGVQAIWIRLSDVHNQVVGDPNGYIYPCDQFAMGGIPWDYGGRLATSYVQAIDQLDGSTQTWVGNYRVEMQGWNSPYATTHTTVFAGTANVRVFAGQQNTFTIPMTHL